MGGLYKVLGTRDKGQGEKEKINLCVSVQEEKGPNLLR